MKIGIHEDQAVTRAFVRLLDGRYGRIVRRHLDHYNRVIVQMNPLGKGRHKDRIEVVLGTLVIINEMEVIAEAVR